MGLSRYYRIVMYWIFGVGFLVLPFVWWPTATVSFELPRVWFLHRWVEVLIVLTIIFASKVPDIRIDKKLVVLIGAFFVVAVVASVVGADVTKSMVGNYWRGDGIATLGHLIGLAVLMAVWWDKKLAQILNICLGVSVVIVGVGAVLIPGFTFGQPNFLAGWLLVAAAMFSGKFKIIIITVAGIGIVASQSWATLLILGAYLAYVFPKLRIFAVVGVVVVGGVWLSRKQNFSWLGPQGVVYESRERIFRKVGGGVLQRPVLGWGFANIDYAFESTDWPFPVSEDVYVDKAHSNFLEVAATMGLIGLIVYITVLLRMGWNLKRTLWLVPLIVFVLHSQTNIVGIGEEILFWIIAGRAMYNGEYAKS